MADSKSWAQEVLSCDLCDKPIQQFCNSCQVNLCIECIHKHVEKFRSLSHDIVYFKNKKIQWVLPECTIHLGQRCEAQCQQCQIAICIKCCIGSHKNHDAVELTELLEVKKQEIQKETDEIENKIIPKYQKLDTDFQSNVSKISAEFTKIEKEKESLRKLWHQEVDNIFDKMGSLIHSMMESNDKTIAIYQTNMKNLIQDMTQTLQQNKLILKTKKASEFTNFKSKLNEYRELTNFDVKSPSMIANTVDGKELSIEIGEIKATLTYKSLSSSAADGAHKLTNKVLKVANIIAVIPTECKNMYHIVCMGENEAWISGKNKTITRVDIHGCVKETIETNGRSMPFNISVTIQGDLVYSDSESRTVKIVKQRMCETLLTTPRGWIPNSICCMGSGDILVCMSRYHETKVIRYRGKKIMQNYFKDEDEKPLFQDGDYVPYLKENCNGDICVSDVNARCVVVLNKAGRVRFRYDGTPARQMKTFNPRDIATDVLCQIIVTDFYNSCLHILDQNGQFLRCVDNCGLEQTNTLSVDSKGRIWAGLFQSGVIKVIQLLK